MVKFEANGKRGKVVMNLPTNLNEVTSEYLNGVTSNIKVGDNYSLIAIIYRESIYNVILAGRKKDKTITTAVVPVFIKAGATDNNFVNSINTNDNLIISASDIAMGHHVTAPTNKLTIDNILSYVEGDKEAYQNAAKTEGICCFIEFKIVPNCSIHGIYKTDIKLNPSLTEEFIKVGE